MNYKKLLSLGVVMVLGLSLSHLYTSPGGAPTGHTNAPGETNCTSCHNSNPLNSGTGVVNVTATGLDEELTTTFGPGETLNITVDVEQAEDFESAGFQITVLDGNDEFVGTYDIEGGPSSSDIQVLVDNARDRSYITHSSPQPTEGGRASWSFQWVAPEAILEDDEVTFYVSVNASQGTGVGGTFVYAETLNLNADLTSSIADANPYEVKAFPNPTNGMLQVSFNTADQQNLQNIQLFNINGQKVADLWNGQQTHGDMQVLDIDLKSYGLNSGLYFLRFSGENSVSNHKIILQ